MEGPKPPAHTPGDYVCAVYGLARSGNTVTTTSLARDLGVSPSTASGMVSKLRTQGLVEHAPHGTISTTRAGTDSVLSVLWRRSLIEDYLVHALGCCGDHVGADAAALEGAASPLLIQRVVQAGPDRRDDPSPPLPRNATDPSAETAEQR